MIETSSSKTVTSCRVCGSTGLRRYLDLGRTPLANSYIAEEALGEPEFAEELCLQVCLDCGLSQLTKVVDPDILFRNYLYVTGTTETMRAHFAAEASAPTRA